MTSSGGTWLHLKLVYYPLGNSGQALFIKSCHEDLILTRKSHNFSGIAFIQGYSVGGSKLIEQTLWCWCCWCTPPGNLDLVRRFVWDTLWIIDVYFRAQLLQKKINSIIWELLNLFIIIWLFPNNVKSLLGF